MEASCNLAWSPIERHNHYFGRIFVQLVGPGVHRGTRTAQPGGGV
jgi:hypothetical protein